ncbi:MAG TPA: hypothetical protein DD632_02075 [Oribacterium sp.]|nr:hypothetical protein [Oribacterium sp.]HCS67266.1 hypothetical protein [Oribacterium sp.]
MMPMQKSAEIVCDSLTAFDGSLEKSQKQRCARNSVGVVEALDMMQRKHEGGTGRRFRYMDMQGRKELPK